MRWIPFWSLFLYSRETPTQMFSCKYCEIFKNNYSEEHLRTAASEWVNWKRWEPKWGTQSGYLFRYSEKANLSRLLTSLLKLSIIKPINNQNCQKSLGFRVKKIMENEEKHKTKLALRSFEPPLSMWKRSVIPKKIMTA